MELGAAARACVSCGYGHVSLLPTWLAADHCRPYPGSGRHAHPTSSQSGLHPTSHCTCPLSPRTMRLGRLSPGHGAWSRRRRARSGGMSHASEPLQSRLRSSPPQSKSALPEAVAPGESLRFYPPPFRDACPGRARPRYAWLRATPAGCRSAPGTQQSPPARGGRRRGRWGERGRGGGAKRAFILPIHWRCCHRRCIKTA